jgi:hypothetical protein
MNILTINLLFNTLVFWVAARLYLLPRLPELRPQAVLLPILLLHSFRHLWIDVPRAGGNLFRDATAIRLPGGIRRPACRLIALAAIPAVARTVRSGRLIVWLFNVEGTVDLLVAITLPTVYG